MAVEPALASSIWSVEKTSRQNASVSEPKRLATGCHTIDKCLDGGFDYGSISCISADIESGGKELSHSLIASQLLALDRSAVTVIDTTNSFDVRRLHKRLVASLRERNGEVDAGKRAMQVLERVRIMKAFDFVGMTECVVEMRERLENPQHENDGLDPASAKQDVQAPRGTVGDSEDEEEMLDEPRSPENPGNIHSDATVKEDFRTLLVIDNIAHITSPILKNNHVQGQALLATFMRSLAHLTRAHDICTLVYNTAVTYPRDQTTEATPSIFSSCSLRPALGKSFAYSLDLHLLLHKVPMTAEDAKSVYATHSAIPQPSQKLASVLEVMQDRHSNRVGHWAAFRTEPEGGLAAVS